MKKKQDGKENDSAVDFNSQFQITYLLLTTLCSLPNHSLFLIFLSLFIFYPYFLSQFSFFFQFHNPISKHRYLCLKYIILIYVYVFFLQTCEYGNTIGYPYLSTLLPDKTKLSLTLH